MFENVIFIHKRKRTERFLSLVTTEFFIFKFKSTCKIIFQSGFSVAPKTLPMNNAKFNITHKCYAIFGPQSLHNQDNVPYQCTHHMAVI